MRLWIPALLLPVLAVGAWCLLDDLGTTERVPIEEAFDGPASSKDAPVLHVPRAKAVAFPPVAVSVAPWIAKLQAEDEATRKQAVWALHEALAAKTVPLDELLELAALGHESLSAKASSRIGHLHLAAAPLFPTLFDWIEKEDRDKVRLASQLLFHITCGEKYRAEARKHLRPFAKHLCRAILNPRIELTFIGLLDVAVAMGPDVAELAPHLVTRIYHIKKARNELAAARPGFRHYIDLQFRFMNVLSAIGPAALPFLADALANEDRHGHFEFGRAIEQMDADALPELRALLSHDNPLVVSAALVAVTEHGTDAPQLLDAVRRLTRHPDQALRVVAVAHLGTLGASAAADLAAALYDDSPTVRKVALKAIARVPSAAQVASPRLLEMMRSDPKAVPAVVLGRLGPAAADAAVAMLDEIANCLANEYMRPRVLRDHEYAVQHEVDALQAFGARATTVLVEAALGDDVRRSEAAVFALHRMSKVDPRSVLPLVRTLGAQKGMARIATAGLLFDAGNEYSLPIVIEGLRDSDGGVRAVASQAICRAGIRGKEAWPALFSAVVLHAKAWRSAQTRHELDSHRRALEVVAQHDLDACVCLLRQPDGDAAHQGALVFAAARERGLSAVKKAWPTLSAVARVQVVHAFANRANHYENPLLVARAWIAAQLDDPSPTVRLAAANAVRERDVATRRVETLVGLLQHAETARSAAHGLKRCSGETLAPFETQIRASATPSHDPSQSFDGTQTWIHEALARIERARPPQGH